MRVKNRKNVVTRQREYFKLIKVNNHYVEEFDSINWSVNEK